MIREFHIPSDTVAALGVTTYLLGLAVGSILWAPLSEMYGRKPIYMASLAVFTLLVLPCALATSFEEILIVRFFGYVATCCGFPNKI
jgi:MFS family permease